MDGEEIMLLTGKRREQENGATRSSHFKVRAQDGLSTYHTHSPIVQTPSPHTGAAASLFDSRSLDEM